MTLTSWPQKELHTLLKSSGGRWGLQLKWATWGPSGTILVLMWYETESTGQSSFCQSSYDTSRKQRPIPLQWKKGFFVCTFIRGKKNVSTPAMSITKARRGEKVRTAHSLGYESVFFFPNYNQILPLGFKITTPPPGSSHGTKKQAHLCISVRMKLEMPAWYPSLLEKKSKEKYEVESTLFNLKLNKLQTLNLCLFFFVGGGGFSFFFN